MSDPRRRSVCRSVDAEQFERLRERVAAGLEWGVGALIERDGRVLLVREDGRWLLPGGGVEAGERRREALAREVREETGLRAEVGDLLAVTDVTLASDGREVAFRFGIYGATVTGTTTDDPGLAGEGIAAVAWHDRLPEDTLDRDLIVALR